MNCENYKNLIDDLVEKKLDEQTSQKIISHLLICQNCEATFEARFDEKEICTDFLFEVKPLNNLSEQFQTKLKIEKQKEIALTATHFSLGDRLRSSFSFLNLKPILASAIILILFGFIYLGLRNSTNNPEQKITAQSATPNPILMTNSNSPAVYKDSSDVLKISKEENKQQRNVVIKTGIIEEKSKSIAVNSTPIKKPIVEKNETQKIVEVPTNNREDEMQLIEIKSFMAETGKQLEKTEMLFRAFRNARIIEESNSFDILYEKQQAQKLLERNIKLRKLAENYGSYDIEETLKTTETLLSEIANLENNPSREEVISIKRRVNNQNVIARLQVY